MGRLPKSPKLRSQARKIKNEVKSRLSALAEWRNSTAGQKHAFWTWFEKMVSKIDPLELLGIFSIALVCKLTIDSTERLKNAAWRLLGQQSEAYVLDIKIFAGLGFFEEAPSLPKALTEEAFEWLISFGVAYIAVKHGVDWKTGLSAMLGGALGVLT